jgi:hypothetical protein
VRTCCRVICHADLPSLELSLLHQCGRSYSSLTSRVCCGVACRSAFMLQSRALPRPSTVAWSHAKDKAACQSTLQTDCAPLRVHPYRRVGDLFSDKTVSSRLVSMARKSVKGVENVYTQHTPLLSTTLESVAKGRLAHMDYPYVGGAETSPTAAKVVV